MKINLKDNLELINQIEDEFPVDKLKIEGVKIWPLIRLSFTQQAKRNSNIQKEKGKLGDLVLKLKIVLAEFWQSIVDKKKSPRGLVKSDVVYLLATDKRIEKVEDAYFAKFADSFINYVDEIGASRQIIEYSYDRKPKHPKYSKSTYISHKIQPVYIWIKIRSKLKAHKLQIENWDHFESYMSTHELKDVLKSRSYYANRFIAVQAFRKVFNKILSKNQPKFMVFMGLHSMINFGLVQACRDKGVKSVEMQHGQQGSYHNMYTHWHKIPEEGYEMMPSHFWMWGTPNANNINSWAQHSKNHQALIGGNTWMSFVKNVKQRQFKKTERDGIKTILISCQLLDDLYESPIKEAILNGPDDLRWFIRLHPSTLRRRQEVEEYFSECGHKGIEFDHANSAYIYDLLSEVDINITFWSTVAYEASAMGVPSIIIHPNGKEGMSKYIEQGIFQYAANAEEILQIIDKGNFAPEVEPFIETDSEIIKTKINYLIESD